MILKGRERAIERSLELALFTAWNTARMTTFHGGKLKTLTEELKSLKPFQPARKQTSEEIIAAMRAIRATLGP